MLRKFSGQLPTYIGGPEKNLGTIPNVKFFTADPYFVVVFSMLGSFDLDNALCKEGN